VLFGLRRVVPYKKPSLHMKSRRVNFKVIHAAVLQKTKTSNFKTEFHPAPGSTRSPNCINYTNADVRLRTPDDGQKDCLKHVES
jgi:hypothetical protein